ncbi:hypothetical protein BJV78DRAFT_1154864 [Lactifluus subvellereus]|nr:hypothetical protein BJV78DRAFT_1154864 [Lactifluus subvellereus]
MSGKLGTFSEKKARGRVQSGCKFSKIKRLPLADITNILGSTLGLHAEVSFPPLQSPTLSEMAMDRENALRNSDVAEARGCLPEALALFKNRPSVQPFLPPSSSHSAIPSPLHDAGSSSRVKSISGVPPVPLPSSLSHLRAASRAYPQRPYDADPCAGHSVNSALPHDSPTVERSLSSSPPGASTREPLSTSLLPPKTHKLAHGQLVILPSRSVLVDFREGERRKGGKGDEVMVGPLLRKIKIQPIVTHSLNELPADRYKLYEQAKKVIEHIKRNVPKFVMYEDTFVCTLMANEPRADLEVRTSSRLTTTAVSAETAIAIRIRFSRKLRTMQIFSNGPRQCKKSMFCSARGVPTDAGDWASLSSHEKECLAALLDFLRTVEAVEGLSRDSSMPLFTAATERPSKQLTKRETAHSIASTAVPRLESDVYPPKDSLPKSMTPAASSPSTVAPPSSRSIQVAVSPRPRFPSALPRATSDTFRKASSTAVSDAPLPSGGSPSSLADRAQSIGPLRDVVGPRLQTRFMPGVGWCVRSGGARYRIMFTDGVALGVDVDEEWVEMVEGDGSVARSYFSPNVSLMTKLTNGRTGILTIAWAVIIDRVPGTI